MSVTVEARIDPLAEQVQRQGDDIDIAGALAIAEQRALDPVGPGHHAELGRGDRGAAVVVRMQAEDQAVAVAHVAREPFDLVGVDVRRRHLDRARQVDDHLLVAASAARHPSPPRRSRPRNRVRCR